ncbi:MAG TPA: MoaD/ThiS family protein [Flavobacterium sp.]|nr:MoaD/ThiS family protein [Flavobacterium sp.]HPJ11340.1 MoaD/ThiS family protein [Flavobacterium sp.]
MIVTVKYFGAVADATQKKEESLYLDAKLHSVEDLRLQLENQYPELKDIAYVIAVNQSVVASGLVTINENDELALLPPFAGG